MRKLVLQVLLLAVLVLCLSGIAHGQFLNDPYVVSTGGMQRWNEAAYNPDRNEYCVTWMNDYVIKWRRLNSTGAVIGSEYAISDGVLAGHHHSKVCYNSVRKEYLIIYSGWMPDGNNNQMRLLRVDAATGNQIGSTIYLDTGYGASSPNGGTDIAYSSTSDSYLAVYEYYNEGKVYAWRLDTYGNPIGSRLQISAPSHQWNRNPVVAWNSVNNEYLVTYMGYIAGDWWDYWAQRVRASDGALLGSMLQITNSHDVKDYGGVAYDPSANRYLVVFASSGNSPKGQLVSNTATLVGSQFAIGTSASSGSWPSVCYDSSKQEFLVGWSFGPGTANYIRRVSQSGVPIGDALNLSGSWEFVGEGNWEPALAYNSVNDEFLMHWHNSYATILNRRYKSAAAPLSPVTNFVATAGNGQNALSWTNPGPPWTGTMIRFKTTGFPTSPTDGTQIYDGSGSSYTHTNLTNGVTYYYTAFAHDATPNYAAGVNASATPSATPGLQIIPQPQELTWKTGTGFTINSSTQIMANSNPDAKEQNMANQLRRKIWDITGHLPSIVYGGSATSNVIAVGDPARCPSVSSIISTWSEASGKASKSEGYMLGIKDTSIVIRGFDNAGSFYGSQTLIQLLEYFKTTTISPLFCYDFPDLPLRAGMWRFINNHDWDFTKELVSEMLARYKINYFFVRVDNGMQWDSHPYLPLNDPANPVTKAQYIDIFNFASLHYMTPGPSSAGSYHNSNEWLTYDTLNSHLRENQAKADPDPKESLCPLHPDAQALVYDLWNEVNAATNAPIFGAGHSEYNDLRWSGCPRCTQYATNAELYNQFIWNDYNWCVPRGKEQVIWGDMLRDDYPQPGYMWNTHSAVATIPKATIIADWEYGTPGNVPTDYPTLDRWINNGLFTIGTPYGFGTYAPYSQYYGDKENIYYWATALNNRKGSGKIKGLMAFNKYVTKNRQLIVTHPYEQQMLGCFPYYAAWSWNVGDPYWNPYPYGNGWPAVERQLSPDRVSNFTATRNGSNNDLSWTNPPESKFQATYIVYKTNGYPTSPIDGTYVADVSGSPNGAGSYTHVGGPSAAYYAAFAHDNVRHFSPVATAVVGVPVACFQEPFAYANGSLNGQGGWSGTATSAQIAVEGQYVKIIGGTGNYDAIKTVNCSADGTGYITVTCRINGEIGVATMWNLWIDDSSERNFARWYGSGTTARGRIGTGAQVTGNQNLSGGWEELKVRIHPGNDTTEFFLNGNSLGIFNHSETGVGNSIGRLRFERIGNADGAGDHLFFDDLVVGDVTPPDTTPPGPVTNFVATPGTNQISLSWTNPTDADFAGTMIRFSTSGYPGSPTGGTQVYNGTGTSTIHSGLTSGVTYYYSAFTYDGVPNYSAAVTVSGVPSGDTTPPGNVTNFTATAGNGQNGLSWTNPGDGDFAGVKIMFKTSGYPTGPTDGTQCYNGSGTSTTHTGLTNGVTYYYKAFAYDAVPNYASGAQASATPASGFCFQDEFMYNDGALVGVGGWTGNATASEIQVIGEMVRVNGGSPARNATKTINCTASPSGLIYVRLLAYRGQGDATMWDVWINDTSGKNIARWYGTGTTARGRIGGTSLATGVQDLRGGGLWDSLNVVIDTVAKTSQFYYNGGSIGTLSYSSTGAGNVVGQIVIERTNNNGAGGHHMYLDNIRVSDS